MDYVTKPLTTKKVRLLAELFRKEFKLDPHEKIPVLFLLDQLADVFGNHFHYEILDDHEFPPSVMARCCLNNEGGFTIEIRESVYSGAHKGNGAFRGFICHEICHIFLFKIGQYPEFNRAFPDNEIPAYCSVEWQAKALCGEVMIPYEDSLEMNVTALVANYGVSEASAKYRRRKINEEKRKRNKK